MLREKISREGSRQKCKVKRISGPRDGELDTVFYFLKLGGNAFEIPLKAFLFCSAFSMLPVESRMF